MSDGKGKPFLNEIDMRLSGVLGELGQALSEAMSKLEDGGGEVHRSQSFQTAKGPIRADAGIRVRMGGMTFGGDTKGDDEPQPLNATERQAATPEEREVPHNITATIVANDTQWSLTAELPGCAMDGLEVTVENGQMFIASDGALRAYRGTFEVPPSVTRDALSISLQNGILDITAHLGPKDAP